MKQYVPMWQLLLKYFGCMVKLKFISSVVEEAVQEDMKAPNTSEEVIAAIKKREEEDAHANEKELLPYAALVKGDGDVQCRRNTAAAKLPVEHFDCYSMEECYDDEYLVAMEEIKKEIHEYEEKYGDKAMEYMRFDSVMRSLLIEALFLCLGADD